MSWHFARIHCTVTDLYLNFNMHISWMVADPIEFIYFFRESGAWANLSPQERDQNISNLTHTGMLARFDNILGRDTVHTLVRLSAHAPFVFCHPTLVERIASMLNYFLLHLVGPTQKNLKVSTASERFKQNLVVHSAIKISNSQGSNNIYTRL